MYKHNVECYTAPCGCVFEAQCFNGSVSVTRIDRTCQEGFGGSSVMG